MTNTEINEIASDALDAAARHIQDKLGVKTGDLAGLFFTGDTLQLITEILASYVRAEVENVETFQ